MTIRYYFLLSSTTRLNFPRAHIKISVLNTSKRYFCVRILVNIFFSIQEFVEEIQAKELEIAGVIKMADDFRDTAQVKENFKLQHIEIQFHFFTITELFMNIAMK